MSIEIYDKAEVIKLNDCYVFMVKHGSKNSYTCPNQYTIDSNFNDKYIRRQSRDSTWYVIAKSKNQSAIADTYWNCPTASIYGRVMFGDRKNIALYLAKKKAKTKDDYTEKQWRNIEQIIEYGNKSMYCIDIDKGIPENKMTKRDIEYCGKMYSILDNMTTLGTHTYWQLDNL